MSIPLLVQFALCPLVLASLLWITAPYGRHSKPGWGPALPGRLAWLLMELPALLTISLLVLLSPYGTRMPALLPLALWCFHYAYRTFVFPMLMRPSDKSFPVLLVLFAVAFNILNGYNNAEALIVAAEQDKPLMTLNVFVGILLFTGGFVIHFQSDRTIRLLRKPGETTYGIPEGGLFRWVSSPQYLGEMIQWCGWAMLTGSAAGLAFALFTICNLAPRALSNHRWYRERFADYPVQRKALIPGVL